MRRRQLKKLWKRLHELPGMPCGRDELLVKFGQAVVASPSAWRLVRVEVGEPSPCATVSASGSTRVASSI